VMNEQYAMPSMPPGAKDGILKGMYRFRAAEKPDAPLRAQLFGSGAILNETLRAQTLLDERYGVAADVWSVTSYGTLYRDGVAADRWNMLHAGEARQQPYLAECLAEAPGPIVAASDYVKALPNSISRWLPRRLVSLGTDGFGRSESRAALRDFFEVDARYIALATLSELAREGAIEMEVVFRALRELDIDPDKAHPALL